MAGDKCEEGTDGAHGAWSAGKQRRWTAEAKAPAAAESAGPSGAAMYLVPVSGTTSLDWGGEQGGAQRSHSLTGWSHRGYAPVKLRKSPGVGWSAETGTSMGKWQGSAAGNRRGAILPDLCMGIVSHPLACASHPALFPSLFPVARLQAVCIFGPSHSSPQEGRFKSCGLSFSSHLIHYYQPEVLP